MPRQTSGWAYLAWLRRGNVRTSLHRGYIGIAGMKTKRHTDGLRRRARELGAMLGAEGGSLEPAARTKTAATAFPGTEPSSRMRVTPLPAVISRQRSRTSVRERDCVSGLHCVADRDCRSCG